MSCNLQQQGIYVCTICSLYGRTVGNYSSGYSGRQSAAISAHFRWFDSFLLPSVCCGLGSMRWMLQAVLHQQVHHHKLFFNFNAALVTPLPGRLTTPAPTPPRPSFMSEYCDSYRFQPFWTDMSALSVSCCCVFMCVCEIWDPTGRRNFQVGCVSAGLP